MIMIVALLINPPASEQFFLMFALTLCYSMEIALKKEEEGVNPMVKT